jgi:multiple sugar transport system permease protein
MKWLKGSMPYLWLLPSLILLSSIAIFPVIELLLTSLSKVSRAGIRKEFIGLENYFAVFQDDAFGKVMGNTLLWTIAVVGISTLLSLGIASLLNQKFPLRRLARAALIVPWAASLIITASIWKWIFDYNYGVFNLFLINMGWVKEPIYWLAAFETSFPAMIWVGISVTIPFTSFVILAGLQAISKDIYEAADVDGATRWEKFWHMTLPSLRHSLTVSTVLNTIYVFNSFPIIWTITRGDPINHTDTVITYLYKLAFDSHKMGEAAALSFISFLIILLFSVVYVAISFRGRRE